MNKEIPEHIYFKHDIDKAFNMGLKTALVVFEKSMGLSYDSQKILLEKVKNMLMEDNVKNIMVKPEPL